MIINTGNRTDIPAFFSEWFYNRISEGYVLVRNPYYPEQVIKYALTPDVVDVLCFCTKNPRPMIDRLDEIEKFRQFWFVTITSYGKDIEPNVPPFMEVVESFKELSKRVGKNCVGVRYDPICINEKYTIEYHIKCFEDIMRGLSGYTNQCVISFIDLYEKTKKNFRGIREVSKAEQEFLVKRFVEIARKYGIIIFTCCENSEFAKFGVDVAGCMTKSVVEKAIGGTLNIPKSKKGSRESCECLLGNDIGEYNTCDHACLYCYANYDRASVVKNLELHDKLSPLLIGTLKDGDIVKNAKQVSYYEGQLKLF